MKRRIVKKYSVMLLVLIPLLLFGINTFEASADVIIDNGGAGTSSTGTWAVSGGTTPYGSDSLWSRDGDTYTWSMSGQPSGQYDVSMWWSGWSSRASSITVRITHRDGIATVIINQKLNAGKWNSLGQYYFDGSGSVTITAANGLTVSTCADAVKFAPVGGGVPSETIIDNSTAGTSSTGIWAASGASGYYGTNALWSRDGATYTWTFTPSATGNYELSMWWTVWPSRSTSIPVSIEYAGGTANVVINQQVGGGQWNVFGTYAFQAGVSYKVTITAANGATVSTCADAVKFAYMSGGGGNTAPVANNDTATTTAITMVTINVLGNDTDVDGNIVPATVSITSNPTHGTAVPQSDGTVQYIPSAGYTGADSFAYTVKDTGDAVSNAATVNITINAAVENVPPVAVNDTVETMINTPLTINVIANDSDADGNLDPGTVSITTNPANGTAVPQGNGTVIYTPNAEYTGTDNFYYTVADSHGAASNAARGRVTVRATNAPPVALNDTVETTLNVPVSINVIANDTDSDGNIDSASCLLKTAPANGTAVIQGNGVFLYTPNAGFTGIETFTYTVADKLGAISNAAVVAVTVKSVNVPPAAVNDAATTDIFTQVIINVLANDSDSDGSLNPATVVLVANPIKGKATVKSDGTVAYTPLSGFKGIDTFQYAVADSGGTISNTATVTVNVVVNFTQGSVLRSKWKTNLGGFGQIMPVMGDIDNDGTQELVMSLSRKIVAVNGKTGAIKWSVPCSTYCGDAVELVDLNNDGTPEILYTSTNPTRIYALNGNGSARWSRTVGGDFVAQFPIMAYDIDGDGFPTIWVASEDQDPSPYNGNINDYNGALTMLDHNGVILKSTWLHHPCFGGMALADTDHDGLYELYVSDRRNGYLGFPAKGLQAFNAGTLEPLWARPDLQHSSPMPVIADVNGDGILDVIGTDITIKGPVVLDSLTGETMQENGTVLDWRSKRIPTHASPTVYDLDGDGHLEYITATSYPSSAPKKFVVFDLISGTIEFEATYDFWIAWPPRVGDVTGDGKMDILVASGNQLDVEGVTDDYNGAYPLIVYDNKFKLIDYVLMPAGTGQLSAARVYDTDGDGYNEVVVASHDGKLMVYDTNARTPNPAPRTWMQAYSELRQGAAEFVPLP